MSARVLTRLTDEQRERWLVGWFVCLALALGVLAAVGSSAWLGASIVILCMSVAAITVPSTWLAPLLAALIPLQLYFNIPGTTFSTRGVVVFTFVAVLRLMAVRVAFRNLTQWHSWLYPAAIFMLAAFIAAFSASNRYLAFRGLYDFGILFAVAFVAGETLQSARAIRATVFALVGAGIFQAVLGLWEASVGTSAVVQFLLNEPIVELFWQSGLLRDNLMNWSVNWIVFERVAPFGTFINGIDYAIFLAAILSLVLALLIAQIEVPSHAQRGRVGMRSSLLLFSVLLMGSALMATFKGSGYLAIACGAATIGLLYLPKLSRRIMALVVLVLGIAFLLVLPFSNLFFERVLFWIQREQGVYGTAGRLAIWLSVVDFFLQRPLFGYGLHNSIYLPEAARSMLGGALVFNRTSTESAYVALLLETGIVGFVALLSVVGLALRRAYQSINRGFSAAITVGVIGAIVAILAGNLTVAGFTSDHNEMLLGLLIGMAFGQWNNQS
jgi:O-antigen ligase